MGGNANYSESKARSSDNGLGLGTAERAAGYFGDMFREGVRRQLHSWPPWTAEELAESLRRDFTMAPPDEIEDVAETLASLQTPDLEEALYVTGDDTPDETHVEEGERPRGLRILTIDDVLEIPDPRPLVHGVLNQGELAMLYGPPRAGKSFLALDLGLAITGGAFWAEKHRTEPGLVVYCALEGLTGFRKRIPAAIVGPIPDEVRSRFVMIGAGVNLRNIPSAGPLINALAGLPESPALVVIDTLHRASAGANENDAGEMGNVIAACDAIRSQFGCAVLLVHHSRKEGGLYRGSSALEGAMDVVMSVTKTTVGASSYVLLKSEKSKDSEEFAPLTFEMRKIVLDGRDQWRCERSSLQLVPTTVRAVRPPDWFRGDPKDYPVLKIILEFAPHGALTVAQLAEHVEDDSPATVRRRVLSLTQSGHVKRTSGQHPKLLAGPEIPASMRGAVM